LGLHRTGSELAVGHRALQVAPSELGIVIPTFLRGKWDKAGEGLLTTVPGMTQRLGGWALWPRDPVHFGGLSSPAPYCPIHTESDTSPRHVPISEGRELKPSPATGTLPGSLRTQKHVREENRWLPALSSLDSKGPVHGAKRTRLVGPPCSPPLLQTPADQVQAERCQPASRIRKEIKSVLTQQGCVCVCV
jgi:hypothetical protein